jgi:hypothetical protein
MGAAVHRSMARTLLQHFGQNGATEQDLSLKTGVS